MVQPANIAFIRTAKENCRVCYTCVRECPAKAIRIAEGQAQIIAERCISCGNCVRVCSQGAKQVIHGIDPVRELLAGPEPVAACLAPSFPAEFSEWEYETFLGMVRALGFDYLIEVAFGADLVARRYAELLASPDRSRSYISTACPAIVSYVAKYHPQLVDRLAPIVSPMVAAARVVRHRYGPQVKQVFIGPCIAKKSEALHAPVDLELDAVLTFAELARMFDESGLDPAAVAPADFDPPRAGLGALFPISRGLLQAADIAEDLMVGDVVATDGRTNFVEAIKEFESGALDARLLEVLACNGCIMGAGMTTDLPLFRRRSQVSRYVRRRMRQFDRAAWQRDMDCFGELDLGARFHPDDQRVPVPFAEEITYIMAKMGKRNPEDELNCGACGYDTCREHAVAIFKGLAESEMCLPHTIDQLRRTVEKLAASNEQLADTREALMQSEKLASMGQLAAGIAHEVNNPLGVVLMYAHLLLDEIEQHSPIREDLHMIAEQADRCKKIVAGLLHFARQNKVQLQPTDVTALVDRVLQVAAAPLNVTVQAQNELTDRIAEIDPDQIVQVLNNLIHNAFSAMPDGGTLHLRTYGDTAQVRIDVTDTGVGIAKENLGKLFEPFFTTKDIGQGTGLGLSVTYGIIKMHRGDIQVHTNADPAAGPTGSTFTVILPRRQSPRPVEANRRDIGYDQIETKDTRTDYQS
ncbi:MAG: 4Fe-4S dicluster domain-containing protein [Sedimentisphaerales bacterium]|nr:4Fe-4S dicluster domain-containing protein [Sedimentisphaerales bacterium]